MENYYNKIIKLNAEKIKIDQKITELKPGAVKELRKMGYSYDNITRMLMIGKITAIKYAKETKKCNII